MDTLRSNCAVVVIGRNEGERLKKCILSVQCLTAQIVYVDSGSSDQSVEWASRNGVVVVALDMTRPFTAARARNDGFTRACAAFPHAKFIQFVDGDCELSDEWLAHAHSFLSSRPDYAAVTGRLRERYPDASIYNSLCDLEWNTPIGQANSFGGNVFMRRTAFEQAGGFRPSMIAGEEPELALRLRNMSWKLWRLDEPMGWHDAAMTRFGQWWTRNLRAGHAYAESAWLHGKSPSHFRVRETLRSLFWGLGLPAGMCILFIAGAAWALMLSLLYSLPYIRILLRQKPGSRLTAVSPFYAVLSRIPEAQGICLFLINRLTSRTTALIEYK
jgi:GT2 family glycosyltransferase